MKLFLLIILIISKFVNNEINLIINGVYTIRSLISKLYFDIKNQYLILSNKQRQFYIILNNSNCYSIETKREKLILGVNDEEQITIFNKKDIINSNKILWNIFKLNEVEYLIQNKFNSKFIEENNGILKFLNYNPFFGIDLNKKIINNNIIKNNLKFNIFKLFEMEKTKKKYLNYVKKESIDIVIKYIDLTDKNIKRSGIHQIYKDKDNEELRYSIRSILEYIPWIRKIFILMPNDKVKFLKSVNEINEKIIFIKDKDILGFESANNPSFLFNLFKMEKFGLSKNFIYMDDDYFIGKPLFKTDFFYFNEKAKKVVPYIISTKFLVINKTFILGRYNELFKKKEFLQPHSSEAFWLQIYCGEKYFIEHYNFSLIYTEFTHNAIAENIDELKEIYEEAKKYEYFNETLFSKERFILTLTHQHFFNLYQLNIKNKKIHSIRWKYISIEKVNKIKLNSPLFVINTGGNHIPLSRQYKMQKIIMEKRFKIRNKYEIINNKITNIYKSFINLFFFLLKLYIVICFIKMFIYKYYLRIYSIKY